MEWMFLSLLICYSSFIIYKIMAYYGNDGPHCFHAIAHFNKEETWAKWLCFYGIYSAMTYHSNTATNSALTSHSNTSINFILTYHSNTTANSTLTYHKNAIIPQCPNKIRWTLTDICTPNYNESNLTIFDNFLCMFLWSNGGKYIVWYWNPMFETQHSQSCIATTSPTRQIIDTL